MGQLRQLYVFEDQDKGFFSPIAQFYFEITSHLQKKLVHSHFFP